MDTNQSNDRGANIPDNDPSKAMDSRKEVEEANDNKIDQDFPGYPHYPAREDIMDQRNDYTRENIDVEELGTDNGTGVSQRFLSGQKHNLSGESDRDGSAMDEAQYANDAQASGRGGDDAAAQDTQNAEIGVPQNVSNEDLGRDDLPGTHPEGEKGNGR